MVITKELYEAFDVLGRAVLTPAGSEILDDRPLFVPGHIKPLSITDQIQRLMRVELSRQAQAQGAETFEEADDLEDDDDDDAPLSVYQKMESEVPVMKPERIHGKAVVDSDLDEAERPEENPESVTASAGGDPGQSPPAPPKSPKKPARVGRP